MQLTERVKAKALTLIELAYTLGFDSYLYGLACDSQTNHMTPS